MILLIEDNEDDVFIMKRAMRGLPRMPMYVARHGQEALDYLQAIGTYKDRQAYPVPTIIFLDLKLPLVNGFDVLTWIRQQPAFKNIPLAILTSSPEERDRIKAAELGAKIFLVKPPTPEMLQEVFRSLLPGVM